MGSTLSSTSGELRSSVLQTLGSQISSGRLTPGTTLSLDGLAERYGVSRSVVREAVSVLVNMGLLESRKHHGTTVQNPAQWNAFDPRLIGWQLDDPTTRASQLHSLIEVRTGVEPVAAALAARRATHEQVELLSSLAQCMHATAQTDLDNFLALDVRYHTVLLEASGNPMFAQVCGIVHAILAAKHRFGLMPDVPVEPALDGHCNLAEAIQDKDAERSRSISAAIVRASAEELEEYLI